ncbi:YugN family protein [Halobacillus sp. B29]|uniref:YugN family protein n=1 Tax=Halobacillus sp. B29 TaxID=3457432 RepID=UPI003FCE8096
MKLESTGLDGLVVDFRPLTELMESNGFILGGSWDYERVTYDYKLDAPEKNVTYYVRVQGFAIEGDVDRGDAVIRLMDPLLGRHYYPHGVEYGEQEGFSEGIIEKARNLIKKIQEPANKYHNQVPEHIVLEKLTKWAEENQNQEVLQKVKELSNNPEQRK